MNSAAAAWAWCGWRNAPTDSSTGRWRSNYRTAPGSARASPSAWRASGRFLATLTHPNVAHLYDAGLAADGQPYLAIEYVEGRRIDVYCDEQSLDVTGAPAAVCAGRRRRGVRARQAHRASRPQARQHPRGRRRPGAAARLRHCQAARGRRDPRDAGHRAFGARVDARLRLAGAVARRAAHHCTRMCTRWASCCTSCCATSGRTNLRATSRSALEDAILQAEPPAPSSVVPAARRRELRGDLDTIVLKALKKKPEERYRDGACAGGRHRSISRWPPGAGAPRLAGPIESPACCVDTSSRSRQAPRWQSRSSAPRCTPLRQAQLARSEQLRAEQVEQFIASILTDTQSAESLTAVGLLKQARARIDDEFADHPLTQIRLLLIVSRSLIGFSEYDAADEAAGGGAVHLAKPSRRQRLVSPAGAPAATDAASLPRQAGPTTRRNSPSCGRKWSAMATGHLPTA